MAAFLMPFPPFRARWQGKPVSTASVAENLRPMIDRYWVAEECATRVADSFEGQRILIEYGLGETEANGGVSDTAADPCSVTPM